MASIAYGTAGPWKKDYYDLANKMISAQAGYVGPYSPENYAGANRVINQALGETGGAPVSTSVGTGGGDASGGGGGYDPVAAKAAADAARAGQLRGEVTNIANTIKGLFDQRYGQVDASGRDQTGKLQTRLADETGDVTRQVDSNVGQAGGAFAARGTRDSSDYGNTVDDIKEGGQKQIKDLGQEFQDNVAKIAQWVSSQKAGFDAQKGGLDSVLSHLAEETSPDNLMSIRNTLEGRLADVRGQAADNNTTAQNMSALESIAPSSTRAQSLKTTLASIIGGNTDSQTKSAIAGSLIANSGLAQSEQDKLLSAFNADLGTNDKKQQQA